MSAQLPALPASDPAFEEFRKEFFRRAFDLSGQGAIAVSGWKHRALDGIGEIITQMKYECWHSDGDPKSVALLLQQLAAVCGKNYAAFRAANLVK
jgi:hypothetical protein